MKGHSSKVRFGFFLKKGKMGYKMSGYCNNLKFLSFYSTLSTKILIDLFINEGILHLEQL